MLLIAKACNWFKQKNRMGFQKPMLQLKGFWEKKYTLGSDKQLSSLTCLVPTLKGTERQYIMVIKNKGFGLGQYGSIVECLPMLRLQARSRGVGGGG